MNLATFQATYGVSALRTMGNDDFRVLPFGFVPPLTPNLSKASRTSLGATAGFFFRLLLFPRGIAEGAYDWWFEVASPATKLEA